MSRRFWLVATLALTGAACSSETSDHRTLISSCDAARENCGATRFAATVYYFPLRDGALDLGVNQDLEAVELRVDGASVQAISDPPSACASGIVVHPDRYGGGPHAYTIHDVDLAARDQILSEWSQADSGEPPDLPAGPLLVTLPDIPVGSEELLVWNYIVVYGEPGALDAEVMSQDELGSFRPSWLPFSLECRE